MAQLTFWMIALFFGNFFWLKLYLGERRKRKAWQLISKEYVRRIKSRVDIEKQKIADEAYWGENDLAGQIQDILNKQ